MLAECAGGTELRKVADYDLTSALTRDERITSALPDFRGRIWFVSKSSGEIGVLDPKTRRIRVLRWARRSRTRSPSTARASTSSPTSACTGSSAGRDGRPRVDWKVTYRNSGIVKPSQVDAGSGTTPTIMPGGRVAITDNADPMNVVVYRTAALQRGQRRVVCEVPVFARARARPRTR